MKQTDISHTGWRLIVTAPFIQELEIRNYKSIAWCSTKLSNLMFLVGPNGSGKSSFIDALKFMSDSLAISLDHALRERGGIKEVRRKSGGHPTHFSIAVTFCLQDGKEGRYGFKVGTQPNGAFEVQEEQCKVWSANDSLSPAVQFHVQSGRLLSSSIDARPAIVNDRLALVAFAGYSDFRPVFDALSRIEIYNLNPKEIASPQKIDPSQQLRRDGSNAASVLRYIPDIKRKKINSYLSQVVSAIKEADVKPLGSFETIEFRQEVKGQRNPWRFLASSMSDGTLRSFGVLLALMQSSDTGPLLIGIEEPETAVHPAVTTVLLRAIREASHDRQILVTSHSPDLLDDPDITHESILSVIVKDGVSYIGAIDKSGCKVLQEKLYTAGQLLRENQIAVDPDVITESASRRQGSLFKD